MTATHATGRHRTIQRPTLPRPRIGMVSLLAAAGIAGWLLALGDHGTHTLSLQEPATVAVQPTRAAPAPLTIDSQGRVVAVSGDTLTTSTPDGRVTTFRITADTAQVRGPFAPQQDVVVHGVMQNGVPVATAIVDQRATGPDGPPMDFGLPA